MVFRMRCRLGPFFHGLGAEDGPRPRPKNYGEDNCNTIGGPQNLNRGFRGYARIKKNSTAPITEPEILWSFDVRSRISARICVIRGSFSIGNFRAVRRNRRLLAQRTFAHQQKGEPDTTGINPLARWGEHSLARWSDRQNGASTAVPAVSRRATCFRVPSALFACWLATD